MKRIVISIGLAILYSSLVACSARAQTAAPRVNLTWTQPSTPGLAGFNVWRAPCTGTVTNGVCSQAGTFVKLNTSTNQPPSYTDTTVVEGQKYDYYVTAVCPTAGCGSTNPATGHQWAGESAPSNHSAASIPVPPPVTDPPPSPTGLSNTVVTVTITSTP